MAKKVASKNNVIYCLLVFWITPSWQLASEKTRDDMVHDTMTLITSDSKNVAPNPRGSYEDVILILGSRGNLSAFPNISQASGSHLQETIPPSLSLYLNANPKTGLVFYNVSNSNLKLEETNASQEVASAFFTKQALDYARKIKILLLFNYSQIVSENRTEFIRFLDDASNFVKNWNKYRPGVAIIASHCRPTGHRANVHIIHRIGRVLQELRRNGTSNRINLIDALLARDAEGSFNRIGYIYKPDEHNVQTFSKSFFEIVQSTKYVPKSGNDFNFVIYAHAKALMEPLRRKVEEKITGTMGKLANQIKAHYLQVNASSSLASAIGKLVKSHKILKNMIFDLERARTRRNFTQTLMVFLMNTLRIPIPGDIFKAIHVETSYVEFCDYLTYKTSFLTIPEWMLPLVGATDAILGKLSRMGEALNVQMEATMRNVTLELKRAWQVRISQVQLFSAGALLANLGSGGSASPSSLAEEEKLLEDLRRDYERLNELVIFLPSAPTFNEFRSRIVYSLKKLSVRNHGNLAYYNDTFISTSDDFSLHSIQGRPTSFNIQSWLRPIDQLLLFLRIEKNQLEFKVRDSEHREIAQEIRRNMQEKCERAIAAVREGSAAMCPVCH